MSKRNRKARILIEFGGKTYRVGSSCACKSKRDCDLYKKGVCNADTEADDFPCAPIHDAFCEVSSDSPARCFKEVKGK